MWVQLLNKYVKSMHILKLVAVSPYSYQINMWTAFTHWNYHQQLRTVTNQSLNTFKQANTSMCDPSGSHMWAHTTREQGGCVASPCGSVIVCVLLFVYEFQNTCEHMNTWTVSSDSDYWGIFWEQLKMNKLVTYEQVNNSFDRSLWTNSW